MDVSVIGAIRFMLPGWAWYLRDFTVPHYVLTVMTRARACRRQVLCEARSAKSFNQQLRLLQSGDGVGIVAGHQMNLRFLLL